MSLFEFTFGLSAVILGLALAHMASTVSKLAMAGRRVKWAPEPLLLAAIIVLVIVSVWMFQWDARTRTGTTIGLMLMQVLKLVLPFMAATFVLPDPVPEEGPVDLYAHYDRTRVLTYGSLILGLLAFWGVRMMEWAMGLAPERGGDDGRGRGAGRVVGVLPRLRPADRGAPAVGQCRAAGGGAGLLRVAGVADAVGGVRRRRCLGGLAVG